MSVRIIEEKCGGCGACVMACPHQNIKIIGGKARLGKFRCIDCGSCIDICPEGAIIRVSRQAY